MKKIYVVPLIASFFCFFTTLASATDINKPKSSKREFSGVAENYLNEKKGATIQILTNFEKDSRWYANFRVKSNYLHYNNYDHTYIQLGGRLRGKTYFTENTAFVGDFWYRSQDNIVKANGKMVNRFDDFDENNDWEQYRFGLEHDRWGAILYGKHTATWSFFSVDMGAQALLDTQADAGLKNVGKFIYKNHFSNNLFINASFDRNSHIYGVDLGYQTADIYQFKPDAIGIYVSLHNGQPSIANGTKPIVGNVNITKTQQGNISNSDSKYARESTNQYTYAFAGFKNIGNQYRFAGQMAYSKRGDESINEIKKKGWAKDGLGYSATIGLQRYPTTPYGITYILYNSWDEFSGMSITPQLEYWFGSPQLRAWISWDWQDKNSDVTRIGFQWDF
ncbi:hypothetical protein [Proteus sp. TJ1640]|uniref:hypothetical protein n=1 Tax=Proteus sp. TJ1640 TaxID=2050968 RepID=UPI000D69BE3F|nr:hypothetical protein [Proteus sp. TJ1640]